MMSTDDDAQALQEHKNQKKKKKNETFYSSLQQIFIVGPTDSRGWEDILINSNN